MIKVYGYYSCGGYKDMYLGGNDTNVEATYFLPLLPMMKQRNKPEEIQKISELEQLPKIEIISQNNLFGFPEEGKIMFSHGGYIAIYRTISNGDACFALRDIHSSTQDEEGRNTPYNIIIVASGLEDIKLLDNFAISFIPNSKKYIKFFSALFSYDAIINGITFDLPALYNNIKKSHSKPSSILGHQKQPIVYLMVDSSQSLSIAMKEQQLEIENISCIIDVSGNIISGRLSLEDRNEPSIGENSTTSKNRESALVTTLKSSSESPNSIVEQQESNDPEKNSKDILELKVIIEMLISEIRNQNIEANKKRDELGVILKNISLQLSRQDESRLLKMPFMGLICRNFKMYIIFSIAFIALLLLLIILFK